MTGRKRTRYEAARKLFEPLGLKATKTEFTSLNKGTVDGEWLIMRADADPNTVRESECIAYSTLTTAYEACEKDPQAYRRAFESRIGETSASATVPTPTPKPTAEATVEAKPVTKSDDPLAEALIGALGPALTARLEGIEARAKIDPEELERAVERALVERGSVRLEIKLPDIDPTVIETAHKLFPRLVQELSLGLRVFLGGPAGSGKTTACEQAAEVLGAKLFVQPPVGDKYELLGFVDAGGTYQPSPAYRAIRHVEEGGKALLLLDEMDRSHPNSLTSFHTVLGNGVAVFPCGEVRIDEKRLLVAGTANTWGIGADAEYVGSCKLDGATTNRFQSRIDWDYDEAFEEKLACANHGGTFDTVRESLKVRANLKASSIRLIWGPRDTFAYCLRRAAGQSKDDAFGVSALASLPDEKKRKALKGV